MKSFSIDEVEKKIRKYLAGKSNYPYLVSADGGREYRKLKNLLSVELSTVSADSFCYGDSFPDFDSIIDRLKNSQENVLCLGFGESVYLSGNENFLHRLQTKSFPVKAVVLCRGMKNLLTKSAERNSKLRRFSALVSCEESFSVLKCNAKLNIESDAENFPNLLRLLEDGRDGIVKVKTDLPLENIQSMDNAYDAIKLKNPKFNLARAILSEAQWNEFLEDDFLEETAPDNWRYYLAGKLRGFSDSYLRFVSAQSSNYSEYAKNIFFALLTVDKLDKNFSELYQARKKILKHCGKKFLAQYISAALEKNFDAIHYLTDNTDEEKIAMIQAVRRAEKIPEVLKKNFPALGDYLEDFEFEREELTDYFRRYKKIKLCSTNDKEFRKTVTRFAQERNYLAFPPRRAVLDSFDKNSKLYWLDALGVEFCPYISARARKSGMNVQIKIARANLPTVTEFNKDFYENWAGEKFEKNGKLDDLFHSVESVHRDRRFSAPVHISTELSIIDEVLSEIKNSLEVRDAEKIILTSDHGASRLAIIYRGDVFEMTTEGEHGGRCCKIHAGDKKPPFALRGDEYFAMANYDRFAGGRIIGVEIHGGGALEEVLVPVIEFTLADGEISLDYPKENKNPALVKDDREYFDFFE